MLLKVGVMVGSLHWGVVTGKENEGSSGVLITFCFLSCAYMSIFTLQKFTYLDT